MEKVDKTIDKICDYIQERLDGEEVFGNEMTDMIKALAELVTARAM